MKEQKKGYKDQFASDNYAGATPEVIEALLAANQGFAHGYGNDQYTAAACKKLREVFEIDCEVYFVFNGTAANSLALAAMCQSYHSVISHTHAHVETDECGAPEFFSNGTKLLNAEGLNGKISPKSAEEIINRRTDIHFPKVRVISVTQSTELGTVYTPDEIKALHELALKYKLNIHMDGARFANAVASLGVSPAEATWKNGVDVLCFGGTKNGMPFGEAVVFFKKELAYEFGYRCKQAGQLASKMRYMTAAWVGMLQNNLWLDYGRRANQMARRFADGLKEIPGVESVFPVEANAVFVNMSPETAAEMRKKGWHFYDFIGVGNSRFMFSWDSEPEAVDALLEDFRVVTGARSATV